VQCEKGRYFLTGEKKPVFIEVEDVAFFVRGLNRPSKLDYEITLSDGSREALDPHTLDVGPENRFYCRVKDGRIKARFDRKAYYELMKDLTEESGFYGLKRDGLFYPIQRKEDRSVEKATAKPPVVPTKPAKKEKKVSNAKSKSKPTKSKPSKKVVKKAASKSIKKIPKKKSR
jgi:hypothetical protein